MINLQAAPPVAIVTGGAAGIGRGIVHAALRAGYRVSVGDRNEAALSRLVTATALRRRIGSAWSGSTSRTRRPSSAGALAYTTNTAEPTCW